MKKSYIAQFILTVLIGPLGLFYSSVWPAIVMLVVAIGLVALSPGFLLIVWPLTVLIGLGAVKIRNEKVDDEDRRNKEEAELANRRHEELVDAVRKLSQASEPHAQP